MAEKKKAGKGKKILIIFIGLVCVVGIILALVFLLPKGKSAAENFKEVSSITVVDNEDAKADYNAFKQKVEKTSGVEYYSEEVSKMETLIGAVDKVADFYNDYYIFVEKSSHNGEINDAINKIKESQKKLNTILSDAKANVEGGMSHVQNVWVDYREESANYLKAYQKLFTAMNKAYHSELGNVIVTNPASRLILSTVEDYMSEIIKDVEGLVSTNVKGSKESTYSYGDNGAKIVAFNSFVLEFVADTSVIEQYYATVPSAFAKIEEFKKACGLSDLKPVIETITFAGYQPIFNYTNAALSDSAVMAAYGNVRTFLAGGDIV